MMKIKARFAAFAAAMLAAVLCLAACNGGVGEGDDSTVATTAEPPLTFTRGDAAGYVIVIGSNATSGEREAALTLSDAFRLRLGIDLEVTADDGEVAETEMVIGNTSRGVPEAWGTDAHRTGDWFVGAEGKKLWFIGGSDAATESAVNGFIEKMLLRADDGITLGEPLVYYASSRLGSITLNGEKEMKNIRFGLPDTKSFTREVVGILADTVTECYGYEATIAGDGEAADILLTTAELSPEYAGVLGDRAAVLTSVAGKAALVGRDQASLVFAMNRLTAELDSLTALEIKDGEIAFVTEKRLVKFESIPGYVADLRISLVAKRRLTDVRGTLKNFRLGIDAGFTELVSNEPKKYTFQDTVVYDPGYGNSYGVEAGQLRNDDMCYVYFDVEPGFGYYLPENASVKVILPAGYRANGIFDSAETYSTVYKGDWISYSPINQKYRTSRLLEPNSEGKEYGTDIRIQEPKVGDCPACLCRL